MYFREPPLWTTPNRRAQSKQLLDVCFIRLFIKEMNFRIYIKSDTTIQATRLIKRKAIKVVNNE